MVTLHWDHFILLAGLDGTTRIMQQATDCTIKKNKRWPPNLLLLLLFLSRLRGWVEGEDVVKEAAPAEEVEGGGGGVCH